MNDPIIPKGYILKARKIDESDISHAAPAVREIWDYLLRNANHSDRTYNGFTVKRGQLFRSYQDIRDDLHWMIGYRKMRYSEDATKKAMKTLRDTLRITTTKALGGVLITILNYDFYQNPKNYEGTDESTDGGTNKAPIRHQCGTTYNNKNEKNEKNDKNENTNSDPSGSPESPEGDSPDPPKDKTPPCPQKKIIELYHQLLPELSPVADWNKTLEGYLRARWKESEERQDLSWWRTFFNQHIRTSDFLMGKIKRFQANLGWIVKPENFTKILNRQYINRVEPVKEVRPETYAQCQDAERRNRARRVLERMQKGGNNGGKDSMPGNDIRGAGQVIDILSACEENR